MNRSPEDVKHEKGLLTSAFVRDMVVVVVVVVVFVVVVVVVSEKLRSQIRVS
jgi:hypothetical protein